MSEPKEILLAEDDETDVFLMRRAFRDAGVDHRLLVAADGQSAIDLLAERGRAENDRLPALIILDLKMPRRNGLDVLEWIRSQKALRCLPVFVFSSSARREDVERAYAAGANAFLVKPPSTAQRIELVRFFHDWLRFNQAPLAVVEGYRTSQAAHETGIFSS